MKARGTVDVTFWPCTIVEVKISNQYGAHGLCMVFGFCVVMPIGVWVRAQVWFLCIVMPIGVWVRVKR